MATLLFLFLGWISRSIRRYHSCGRAVLVQNPLSCIPATTIVLLIIASATIIIPRTVVVSCYGSSSSSSSSNTHHRYYPNINSVIAFQQQQQQHQVIKRTKNVESSMSQHPFILHRSPGFKKISNNHDRQRRSSCILFSSSSSSSSSSDAIEDQLENNTIEITTSSSRAASADTTTGVEEETATTTNTAGVVSGVDNIGDEVTRLKAEAARMRLDAERMDVVLTLQKIEAMEKKMNDPLWRNSKRTTIEEIEILQRRLQQLRTRLLVVVPASSKTSETTKQQQQLQQAARITSSATTSKGDTNNSEKIQKQSTKKKKDDDDDDRDDTATGGFFNNLNKFFSSNGNKKDTGRELNTDVKTAHKSVTKIGSTISRRNNNSIGKTKAKTSSSSTSTFDYLDGIPGITVSKDDTKTDSIVIKLDPVLFQQEETTISTNTKKSSSSSVSILDPESKDDDDSSSSDVSLYTGFEKQDLDFYTPLALGIEATMPNTTKEERLQAFRSLPALKQHYQMKIAALIIQPMKDMQEMENLKRQYLSSSSRIEKEALKRKIDTLKNKIQKGIALDGTDNNNNGSFGTTSFLYSDTIHYKDLPPLSNEERQKRLLAIQSLPDVLQSMYMIRNNLDCSDDIELAMEIDYYEQQIQLLEQVKLIDVKDIESPDEVTTIKKDIAMAIEALPIKARDYFANSTLGFRPGSYTIDDMVVALCNHEDDDVDDDEAKEGIEIFNNIFTPSGITSASRNSKKGLRNKNKNKWKSLLNNGIFASKSFDKYTNGEYDDEDDDLPEYDDIGYIDRSRYIVEFYPAIARMEGKHPSLDEVNEFITTVIDKRIFMVTSKPERVVGGWYIRGRNLLIDDTNDDSNEDSVALVDKLQNSLSISTKLKDKLQFFYIPDPAPLTDEDYEMEYTSESIFVVTSKEDPPVTFYNYANPFMKSFVSFLGLSSILLVAVGATALQPGIQFRLDEISAASSLGETIPTDLTFLSDTVFQIMLSMLGIQLAHEIGHRIIAWKDKFQLGFPTLVPSVQLGLIGSITPFVTPPPNLKSMFDVAIAGPLFGFTISFVLLVLGLDITSHLTQDQLTALPVFPAYLLRASELGGGIIEFFLGRGTVTQGLTEDALLPLHPFVIAGFTGIMANALALLPLGNTDGGRVSVSMFGRKGAYIVKTFTTILLCLLGLFGIDNSRLFLVYVFYTQIWQRDLESPALNEVDEVDFPRGAVGIIAALIVALTLIPMQ